MMGWNAARLFAAAIVAVGLGGCATNSPENEALGINDPYEGMNRDIHAFNKGADQFILRPVAKGYEAVTPGAVKLMVGNALNHLEAPRDFANHVLTAEASAAGRTVARFAINTFIGAGGLLDPASEFDLGKEDADFGKTLAVWGAGEGFYYEIPLLGPSTVRHSAGRIVDIAFAPTLYLGEPITAGAVNTAEIVSARAANASSIDSILYDSVDSYLATRSFYIESRRAFVNGGSSTTTEDGGDYLEDGGGDYLEQ